MRLSRIILIGAGAGCAAISVVLGVGMGWLAGMSFVSGALLGAVSLAGLAALGKGVSGSRSKLRRAAAVFVHLLKYPLVVTALYFLLTRLHANPVLTVVGYTLAVATFVASLAVVKPPKARPSQAE